MTINTKTIEEKQSIVKDMVNKFSIFKDEECKVGNY